MSDKIDEIKQILDEGKVQTDEKVDEVPDKEITEDMSKEQLITWQIDKLCHEGVFRYELISVVQELCDVLKAQSKINEKILKSLSELDKEDD